MSSVNQDHLTQDVGQNCLPDLDEWSAVLEGEVAAMCGLKPKDNPYPYPSKYWVQWNNGFCRESPRRDETESDTELRVNYQQRFLETLKTHGAWKWVKPPTQKERAEWADDTCVMTTIMRRKLARRRQKEI